MSETDNKPKIVLIDDSEINRAILADILEDEYDILEAGDGVEGIAQIRKHEEEICLVLLDIIMPEMDGFEVLTYINRSGWIDRIPVIMISAEMSSGYIDRAYELGAVDYIQRPFDGKVVLHRVHNTVMLYARQRWLQDMVAEQTYEKEKVSHLMVEILSNIVEFRNGESGLHVLHIRTITEALLKELALKTDQYPLSAARIELISNAASLHDIGKIAIDEKILNKPGKLTKEEFEVMKTHSAIGADMMKSVPGCQDEELVKVGYAICRWHHERYDGRGYPDGLKGEEIPIEAQVVSLADVYDALTSERVYKPPFPHEKAMEMIKNGECGAFSPLLMECLQDLGDRLVEILRKADARNRGGDKKAENAEKLPASGNLPVPNRAIELLEHERIRYQFLESLTCEILFEYDAATNVMTFSPWSSKHLGVPEVIVNPGQDKRCLRIVGEERLWELWRNVQQTTPDEPVYMEDCCLNVSGRKHWYRLFTRSLWGGPGGRELTGVLGKFVDINNDHERLDELAKLADSDRLTGLYNHAAARKLIEQQLRRGGDLRFGLLIFDLDHFKDTNDRFGHLFGDSVLRRTAEWLKMHTRREDISARIGGDEFMIFMEYTSEFEPLAKRIFQGLTASGGDEYPIGLSMGAALWPEDGETYEELFHAADQALYVSKREGRNCLHFYQAETMGEVLQPSPEEADGK